MKKITEKGIYIAQIIVYLILMVFFVMVKDDQLRYIAIFIGILITFVLNIYNIYFLGNRKKKEEKKKTN